MNRGRQHSLDWYEVVQSKFKSIEELRSNADVQQAKHSARIELQNILDLWCKRDSLKQIPVNLSLKPKMKLRGLYFENKSICIFPIQAIKYDKEHRIVRKWRVMDIPELIDALEREYTHHLMGMGGVPHGQTYTESLHRVREYARERN